MGSKYEFQCTNCGYTVCVSGKKDYGFRAVVETMVCGDCHTLTDILIGAYGKDGLTGDPDYDNDIGVCPGCRGRNLSKWPKLHPCPKCGARMDNIGIGPSLMWD